jgi:DNA polymerase-3 subunit epsilon
VGALVQRLDDRAVLSSSPSSGELGYLDVLGRALADRRVTAHEIAELSAVAEMYELDLQRIETLHRGYLSGLLALALLDDVVTPREQADLELVAALLGIEDASDLLAAPSSATPSPEVTGALSGKSVCFTGTLTCRHGGRPMTRAQASELAAAAGLDVHTRVTKSLDYLVVADPRAMSGKARKAHEYGTHVIAETAFWPLIGVQVS